jgi:hypothetical protein
VPTKPISLVITDAHNQPVLNVTINVLPVTTKLTNVQFVLLTESWLQIVSVQKDISKTELKSVQLVTMLVKLVNTMLITV